MKYIYIYICAKICIIKSRQTKCYDAETYECMLLCGVYPPNKLQ